jgi:DNA-binding response OmpR family regulator
MIPSLTILLLDDEPMLRRATAMLLARRGGHVTAAASPDEAVALSGARVYDVAIFDVSAAGPSAPDVLRRMRETGLLPRRVIAVCDAPLDRGDAVGFAAVLHKPYAFERLAIAVFGHARRGRREGPSHRAALRASPMRARPRRRRVTLLRVGRARPRRLRRLRRAARGGAGRG